MFEPKARVLQKLNVEDREKKVTNKVYKESKELRETEILVTIEHW